MIYRSIYWDHREARLKSFTSSSKSGSRSIVKIEIEVSDPFRLGALLQDLEQILREQAADDKTSAPAPKRASPRRRAIASQPPLMLTYREGDVL